MEALRLQKICRIGNARLCIEEVEIGRARRDHCFLDGVMSRKDGIEAVPAVDTQSIRKGTAAHVAFDHKNRRSACSKCLAQTGGDGRLALGGDG